MKRGDTTIRKLRLIAIAGALSLVAVAEPAAAQRTTPVTVENEVAVDVANTVGVRNEVVRYPVRFRRGVGGADGQQTQANLDFLLQGDLVEEIFGNRFGVVQVPDGFLFVLTGVEVGVVARAGDFPRDDLTPFRIGITNANAEGFSDVINLYGQLYTNSSFQFGSPAFTLPAGGRIALVGNFENSVRLAQPLFVDGAGYLIREEDFGRE